MWDIVATPIMILILEKKGLSAIVFIKYEGHS